MGGGDVKVNKLSASNEYRSRFLNTNALDDLYAEMKQSCCNLTAKSSMKKGIFVLWFGVCRGQQ